MKQLTIINLQFSVENWKLTDNWQLVTGNL